MVIAPDGGLAAHVSFPEHQTAPGPGQGLQRGAGSRPRLSSFDLAVSAGGGGFCPYLSGAVSLGVVSVAADVPGVVLAPGQERTNVLRWRRAGAGVRCGARLW